MKKLKQFLDSTNGAIIISVLAATLCAFLFLPSAEVFSTLPFVTLISALTAFFVKQFFYLPAALFLLSFWFSMAKKAPVGLEDVSGGYALRTAIYATAISVLACLGIMVLKSSKSIFKNKVIRISVCILPIVASVILGAYCNGTPWKLAEAKGKIQEYAEERFDTNGIEVSSVYRITGTDIYACDFHIRGLTEAGMLKYENDRVYDGVTDLYVKTLTESDTAKLINILRQAFPGDSYSISCSYIGKQGDKLSLPSGALETNCLNYTIKISKETTAKSFIALCETYYKAVAKSCFPCTNVTIVGGAKHNMYYTMTANPYAPSKNLASLLKIYSPTLIPSDSIESINK